MNSKEACSRETEGNIYPEVSPAITCQHVDTIANSRKMPVGHSGQQDRYYFPPPLTCFRYYEKQKIPANPYGSRDSWHKVSLLSRSIIIPSKEGIAIGTMISDPRPVEVRIGIRARMVVARSSGPGGCAVAPCAEPCPAPPAGFCR